MTLSGISYPSLEFKNQLRDGIAPIDACAFNAPRHEFLAVDASTLRVWGFKREIKAIMAPGKIRFVVAVHFWQEGRCSLRMIYGQRQNCCLPASVRRSRSAYALCAYLVPGTK